MFFANTPAPQTQTCADALGRPFTMQGGPCPTWTLNDKIAAILGQLNPFSTGSQSNPFQSGGPLSGVAGALNPNPGNTSGVQYNPSANQNAAGQGAQSAIQNAGLTGFLNWIGTSANWKHTGLLLGGALLILVGVFGLAADKYMGGSGPKILPV
jgi:hypothetical protein